MAIGEDGRWVMLPEEFGVASVAQAHGMLDVFFHAGAVGALRKTPAAPDFVKFNSAGGWPPWKKLERSCLS